MSEAIRQNIDSPPPRISIPPHLRSWSINWPEYNPPFYESPRLQTESWAEPTPASFWNEQYVSNCGTVLRDEAGRPLNPNGRTGTTGRGVLGKYGANQTADGIVLKIENSRPYLATIIRRDNGSLAIPGGFIDKGESAPEAAARELSEETNLVIDDPRQLVPIHKGVVKNSGRATDNAWLECNVYGIILDNPPETLEAGDDARPGTAKWRLVSEVLQSGLHDDHREYLLYALQKFGLY